MFASAVSDLLLTGEGIPVIHFRSIRAFLVALRSEAIARTATIVVFGSATDAGGAAAPNLVFNNRKLRILLCE